MKRGSLLILTLYFVTTNSKSIGNSENNATEQDTSYELFPDWVPFKNKHGDQLGEFVPVEQKKPKKRLALPMNFVLKAFAEPEDDYFDSRQGESDSENYYEKQEWSDLNRSAQPAKMPTNHSDVEGVVGVITRHHPNSLKHDRTNESKEASKEEITDINEDKEEEEENKIPKKEYRKEKKTNGDTDYSDYDEVTPEKPKPGISEEERKENEANEAKKARILDSVDELKERHALEQKALFEKVKEEAMHKEERARDIDGSREHDKYNRRGYIKNDYDDYEDKDTSIEDKYKIYPMRRPTQTTSATIPTKTTTIYKKDKKYKEQPVTGKLSVFRNPSVYMLYDDDSTTDIPRKSTVTTEATTHTESTAPTGRYSSRYSSQAKTNSDESERISLVPDDNELKEGEPTLFFPRKRKIKRKHKNSTTTPKYIDSNVAASHPDKATKDLIHLEEPLSAKDATGFDSAPSGASGSSTGPSASDSTETNEMTGPARAEDLTGSGQTPTGPSGPTAIDPSGPTDIDPSGPTANGLADSTTGANEPTGSESAELETTSAGSKHSETSATFVPLAVGSDAEPASSDHNKDEKKSEAGEYEKGGEREHHSEHHSSHGESGKKAYEGEHKDKKTNKGHHDKEDHLGSYHDHGGHDEHHHDEKKHYGKHHHEEHGKKHAEYEESGKHSKGHSTKGSHDIHKKDEYEKKVEFFEEEGDSIEEEKHGGHKEEKKHHSGGNFKKDNHGSGFHEHSKGDSGHIHKGGFTHADKGHKLAAGHDEHGKHGSGKLTKGFREGNKKWIYHHGYPAKNANLVVIDRRTDQLYHGPQYYG